MLPARCLQEQLVSELEFQVGPRESEDLDACEGHPTFQRATRGLRGDQARMGT